nr:putative ribonuclease H-like domain-containing protein [Tanacetum cinerariifolium]
TEANSHVTPDLEAMDNLEAYYGDGALHFQNDICLPILHIGSSKVYLPQKTFSLKNILYVPEISHNLLSVHKFCHDNDVFFEFHTSYFVVKDESTHTTLLTGPSKYGLYTITLPQLKSINKVSFLVVRASPTICHRRIGHSHQRIIHRRSCPHTSEQNGFVERRNRHVVETGLTLLAQACVPQRFWHYAFDNDVYLINRMPSRTLTNKSPFEHIFKRSPDYSFLHVFGPSSPRSPISSPSSVSHLSPTSQTSSESSNGQPSPVSTTSIPTPPPPIPPSPPPPITRQRPVNFCQNLKQRVP